MTLSRDWFSFAHAIWSLACDLAARGNLRHAFRWTFSLGLRVVLGKSIFLVCFVTKQFEIFVGLTET